MQQQHTAHSPASLTRWSIGGPADAAASAGEGVVALTADGLSDEARRGGAVVLGLHEAMVRDDLPRAPLVDVHVPSYRGKAFVTLLSWLVSRHLATEGGTAAWFLAKQQGAGSLPALLTALGWRDVSRARTGRLYRIAGRPPVEVTPPQPRTFAAQMDGHVLTFAADYGVFSPGHIDEGTAHLFDVALRQPHVSTIADVGVGYGPLALGLVRAGVADRAVATDVDSVALWLAGRNAEANDVPLDVVCSTDPLEIEDTPLTVCNVPTHIDVTRTTALMRGLARRTSGGHRLLAVVHASLEERYVRHLADVGLTARRHPGKSHVVLEADG
ncbi:methyltransferase [Streptomyces sp. MP131-18]|uniref:methyltransferase n=1 Tax=Streptomyces sp. MP131-18 TaxID=1857892 RepID=UPI0015C575FC|nr:methyltransferase [Streptomyces sp. MP131-18]